MSDEPIQPSPDTPLTELFPTPWRITKTEGGHFRIEDNRGRCLAVVYGRDQAGLEGEYLKPADALVMARAIAMLSRTER